MYYIYRWSPVDLSISYRGSISLNIYLRESRLYLIIPIGPPTYIDRSLRTLVGSWDLDWWSVASFHYYGPSTVYQGSLVATFGGWLAYLGGIWLSFVILLAVSELNRFFPCSWLSHALAVSSYNILSYSSF